MPQTDAMIFGATYHPMLVTMRGKIYTIDTITMIRQDSQGIHCLDGVHTDSTDIPGQ
jgi:hypothetical protein